MNWTQKDIVATGLTSNLKELPAVKKPKYGNVKTNGFDSKKEHEYYQLLRLRERAGEVTGIQTQVSFQLSVCKYIADFVFYHIPTQKYLVIDVKGMKTQVYKMKCKMMLKELGIQIIEI